MLARGDSATLLVLLDVLGLSHPEKVRVTSGFAKLHRLLGKLAHLSTIVTSTAIGYLILIVLRMNLAPTVASKTCLVISVISSRILHTSKRMLLMMTTV
jgi:hypothetical protein